MVSHLWQEEIDEGPFARLRFAARSLRTSPGFTVLAVLILTLGIGVTVTIFSVMYAVLWRPLPYPNADDLVVVETVFGPVDDAGLAQAEVVHLRHSSKTMQSFAMINGVDAFVSANGEMEHVSAATVTDDMLPLLGAVPAAPGRPLQAANDIQASRVTGVYQRRSETAAVRQRIDGHRTSHQHQQHGASGRGRGPLASPRMDAAVRDG